MNETSAVDVLSGFTEPEPYTRESAQQAANVPGVHIVWDPHGECLYVGQTARLRERLLQHLSGDRGASVLHQKVGLSLDQELARTATKADVQQFLADCTVAWHETTEPRSLKAIVIRALIPKFNEFTPPVDLETNDTLHLLLRWKVGTEPQTITYHREVAESQGSVWWRKLGGGRGPREEHLVQITEQLQKGSPTFVFIRRPGEVWRTRLHQIERGDFSPPGHLVPSYYEPEQTAQLWLHLSDFTVLPGDWPEKNLVYALPPNTGQPVEFSGQNALYWVRVKPTVLKEEPVQDLESKMATLLEGILSLQPQYSSSATPDMERRQQMIAEVAAIAEAWLRPLNDTREPDDPLFEVEGGGLAGNYAVVPWVRIFSRGHSPKATQGIYLVFLFSCDGQRVFLSLNQGTSEFRSSKWRPVTAPNLLVAEAESARSRLKPDPRFNTELDLALAAIPTTSKETEERLRAYEAANIFTATYGAGNVEGGEVHRDLLALVEALAVLYETEEPAPVQTFGAPLVQELVDEQGLLLNPEVVPMLVAALESGKHVILTGPPGTAKTTLAQLVGRAAALSGRCLGYRLTTATSDWTTFETVGGLRPSGAGNELRFESGQFLSAIEAEEWLIVDELNRSNFDRAFGQLFTVLAGQPVELPYAHAATGLPIEIAPEDSPVSVGKHRVEVPASWRLIGTMNVFDKSLLFEMSFALMRRFCFIEVEAPPSATYLTLVRREVGDEDYEDQVVKLIEPLLALRKLKELGPSLFMDMSRFATERLKIGDTGLSRLRFQLFYSYLLPQFEGITDSDGRRMYAYMRKILATDETMKLKSTLADVLGLDVRGPLFTPSDEDEPSSEPFDELADGQDSTQPIDG